MSAILQFLGWWLLVAVILGPPIGRFLKRRAEEQSMALDVREGLDAHYKKSGRPGMAQHDALGRPLSTHGSVLKNA